MIHSQSQSAALAQRAFGGPSDLDRMTAMLASARASDPRSTYWHAGDLAWRYFLLTIGDDARANIRLWGDDDGVAGFAWFDPRDQSFDIQIHPRAHATAAGDDMLDWIENRRRLLLNADSRLKPRPLFTGGCEDDAHRLAMLERRGYRRGDHFYYHLWRSLDQPLPPAALPPGFAARCVSGRDEHAARAAAHRSAFHPSRVTDAHYLRLMQLPGYDRELDVVTASPDGRVASFALCWVDPLNRVGEFEPVGTHADFRRLGLGRAAMIEGLRRLQSRGMAAAFVMCEGRNEPAVRLYESAGFRAEKKDFDYIKEQG